MLKSILAFAAHRRYWKGKKQKGSAQHLEATGSDFSSQLAHKSIISWAVFAVDAQGQVPYNSGIIVRVFVLPKAVSY